MNLWLGSFLFASLLLRGSAQAPEECQPLISPISLADPSVMYGKTHFLAGYVNTDFQRAMLKITDSAWVNITASPAGNTQVVMDQSNRVNGTCMSFTTKVMIEGNTIKTSYFNISTEYHMLPSCDGCRLFLANSTLKDVKGILKSFNIDYPNPSNEITSRILYIFGNGQTLTESEMEHFKKQASCLGFSGEPDFIYNPEKSLCKEDEGIRLPISQ